MISGWASTRKSEFNWKLKNIFDTADYRHSVYLGFENWGHVKCAFPVAPKHPVYHSVPRQRTHLCVLVASPEHTRRSHGIQHRYDTPIHAAPIYDIPTVYSVYYIGVEYRCIYTVFFPFPLRGGAVLRCTGRILTSVYPEDAHTYNIHPIPHTHARCPFGGVNGFFFKYFLKRGETTEE